MRWQSTAALAVVLIALAGFYYVYEVRLAPEREKAEARKGRIFTADPKDVVEISVKRAEGPLRLKREGDDWQLQEPLKARADRATAEAVVGAALSSAPRSFHAWRNRSGRRPNFALRFCRSPRDWAICPTRESRRNALRGRPCRRPLG